MLAPNGRQTDRHQTEKKKLAVARHCGIIQGFHVIFSQRGGRGFIEGKALILDPAQQIVEDAFDLLGQEIQPGSGQHNPEGGLVNVKIDLHVDGVMVPARFSRQRPEGGDNRCREVLPVETAVAANGSEEVNTVIIKRVRPVHDRRMRCARHDLGEGGSDEDNPDQQRKCCGKGMVAAGAEWSRLYSPPRHLRALTASTRDHGAEQTPGACKPPGQWNSAIQTNGKMKQQY